MPDFDVVIVGAGGSGLAAAARCAELGLSVVVLEKQPRPGGTTGIAVGSFTASKTGYQRKAGITDAVADHAVDAGKFAVPEIEQRNNRELRRYFLEHAADTLDWLSGMGLGFHGPSPEPPNRVPRMHNVIPNAKAYIAALQAVCLRKGGMLICDAAVEELISEDGRIAGVVARCARKRIDYRARLGVILAAGDYASSVELIARFKGNEYADVDGINPHAAGDGHRLAEAAGAQLVNMDVTYGPELRFIAAPNKRTDLTQLIPVSGMAAKIASRCLPFVPRLILNAFIKRLLVTWQHPENSLFDHGAILVNQHGKRFCNERQSPERELRVASQPGKQAFILLDERLVEMFSRWPHFISTAPEIAYAYVADYLKLRPDVAIAAATLDDLADRRQMPSATLRTTVDAVNAERESTDATQLEGEHWVFLGPLRSYFTTTEGGAAINQQFEVLDREEQPIRGLYAIGQNGLGGQILWGHGLHISWAITSGRLVAEHLAGKKANNAAKE